MSLKNVSANVVPQSNAQKSRIRRTKAREIQHLVLEMSGCAACGHTDKDVLEYHHIDKRLKTGDISSMASRGAIRQMAEEMTKCAVVCCNCHRLVERKKFTGTLKPVSTKMIKMAFRQVDEVFPSLI